MFVDECKRAKMQRTETTTTTTKNTQKHKFAKSYIVGSAYTLRRDCRAKTKTKS